MTEPSDRPLVDASELRALGPLAGALGARARAYHVGFVVPDLEQAIVEVGALLGVPFTDPAALPVASVWGPDGRSEAEIRYAYSTRPMHVELIESVPGTLWDFDDRHRGHHLGVWTDDVEEEATRLAGSGMPALWWGTTDTGRWVFSYHLTSFGFYIELVDVVAKPFYQHWFAEADPALLPWRPASS